MSSTDLNGHEGLVLWFDDLGSGNEEYRLLSNFYKGEQAVVLPGVTWENLFDACKVVPSGHPWFANKNGPIPFVTGEHAFAAMKFWGTDATHFGNIVDSEDPNDAKALGRSRQHPLREDWEIVKLDVMAAVLRSKFTLDREEGKRLLDTGDKILVEGTWWYDDVWGVDLRAQGMPGRNWLGTLLMARRAELRAHHVFGNSHVGHFATFTGKHNSLFSLM